MQQQLAATSRNHASAAGYCYGATRLIAHWCSCPNLPLSWLQAKFFQDYTAAHEALSLLGSKLPGAGNGAFGGNGLAANGETYSNTQVSSGILSFVYS